MINDSAPEEHQTVCLYSLQHLDRLNWLEKACHRLCRLIAVYIIRSLVSPCVGKVLLVLKNVLPTN